MRIAPIMYAAILSTATHVAFLTAWKAPFELAEQDTALMFGTAVDATLVVEALDKGETVQRQVADQASVFDDSRRAHQTQIDTVQQRQQTLEQQVEQLAAQRSALTRQRDQLEEKTRTLSTSLARSDSDRRIVEEERISLRRHNRTLQAQLEQLTIHNRSLQHQLDTQAVEQTDLTASAKPTPAVRPTQQASRASLNMGNAEQDNRPKPVAGNVKPLYPIAARNRGIQGEVQLRVSISPSGKVDAVTVEHSSGSPLLDSAAIKAVRTWQYHPLLRNGQPVATTDDVPVRFELNES